MNKPEKDQLFRAAHAQLKLALAFAEGITDAPSASLDAVCQVNRSVAKASAMMQSFENAMREVTSTPTAQSMQQ